MILGACARAEPGTNVSASTILAEAGQRIERHRKGDGLIRVLDAEGTPIPGAKVVIEQTRHAFLFGSNIYKWGTCRTEEHDAAYRRRFVEVFNYATLPFYWWSYEPQEGQPNHAYRQRVAEWCRDQKIVAKGHPLVWNYNEPQWLPDDPSAVVRKQMQRVTDCVARFAGLIDVWDVVNEAAQFERSHLAERSPKMTAAWNGVGRVEFARRAFKAARAANRNAVLLINDYRTEDDYEKVIEGLVDAEGNRLYDVIGIQSHMHGGLWPVEKTWQVCERFARFDVPLHFTEVTVLSGENGWELTKARPGFKWESTPEGEKRQAEQVEQFYTVLFSHPAVEAITWWDFTDQGSWQHAPAGWLDDEMNPKPVFETMKRLIRRTWWTRLEEQTDTQGVVRFRGFRGDYGITVHTPDGRTATETFELGATGLAEVRVK